jgi:hypothetical protein
MGTGHIAAPGIGRRGTRRSYLRLNLGLTLCLAAVLATGCGSATPAASTAGASSTTVVPTAAGSGQVSPSAAASSITFASHLYGYGLAVPAGWHTYAADSSRFSGAGLEGRCSPDWDCFSGPSGDPTLAAAAASVQADQTLDQWRSRMQASLPYGCIDSAQTTATTLGGEPAQTWTTICEGEGLDATKVVALHAGQGYILLYVSPISVGLETDRDALSSILTTFRFAPS